MVKDGASFVGLDIANGRNKEDRVLFFDNLAVFIEQFPPLTFEPRPERGIAMFPGQGSGTNTGPGKLPFPNRPETILPDNLVHVLYQILSKPEPTAACSYFFPEVHRDSPATSIRS